MVLDHRHQGLDVIGVEAHAGGDRLQEVDAHLGVVTRVALPDVVEQGAHQQEVRPVHPVDETRCLGGGLHEVPVDGEAVVGVALGPGPARLPLGYQLDEEPHVVEVLDDRYGRRPSGQQRHEHLARLVRPRVAEHRGVVGQPLQGPALQVCIVLGGDPRTPQREERIGQVGIGRERQAPIVQHQAGCHLPSTQVDDGPQRPSPTGGPCGAAGRSLTCPRDRASRRGHLGHQDVGVSQVQCGRHVVLELQQEAIGPLPGEAVELDAYGQERLGCCGQARRLGLTEDRHGGLLHPEQAVHVAKSSPGLLQVGFQQEGDLSEPGMALGYRRLQVVKVASRPTGPLFQRCCGKLVGHRRVAGHRAGRQEARGRVQVLGGHLQELGQRPHLVAELQARIPERVPDPLGDLGHVQARPVHEHHVDVTAGTLLPTAVSADRHEGGTRGRVGRLEDLGQEPVDPVGQRTTERGSP